MKDPTPFTDFCNAVCAQVRFRPDRAAIQAELLDHLQDHADALKERGVPILDAREEAVAAMGDPVELGKALDRLHGPLAGWLLRVLKWASNLGVAAVCLMIYFVLMFGSYDVFHDLPDRAYLLTPQGTEAHWRSALSWRGWESMSSEVSLLVFHPSAHARAGDYLLSVPYAVRVLPEEEDAQLFFHLKVVHLSPWARSPDLGQWLSGEDDLGNSYPSDWELRTAWQQGLDLSGSLRTSVSRCEYSLLPAFVTYYDGWVTGLDPDATQVTLTFDRFGQREFILPISLEGGKAP